MVAFNTYKRWMEQPGHTFVYLEMRVGADNAGKMIFEVRLSTKGGGSAVCYIRLHA